MSLTDLKRKHPQKDLGPVNVEDFIDDANNYAFGRPSLLSADDKVRTIPGLNKSSTRIYRHATFSLSLKSIAQLDELAKHTGQSKSKLLRILIKDFHNQSSLAQELVLKRGDEDA